MPDESAVREGTEVLVLEVAEEVVWLEVGKRLRQSGEGMGEW